MRYLTRRAVTRLLIVVLALCSTLAASGCAAFEIPYKSEPVEGIVSIETDPCTEQDLLQVDVNSCRVCTSLENCYTDSQMGFLYTEAIRYLQNSGDEIGKAAHEIVWRYAPNGWTLDSSCVSDDNFGDEEFSYCASESGVVVGETALRDFYRSAGGDVIVYLGLAHEVGHHIIFNNGIDESNTRAELIELGADCMMGIAFNRAAQLGRLEQNDMPQYDSTFGIISFEGVSTDIHGTPSERRAASELGRRTQAIDTCLAVAKGVHPPY
ncbi:hypothetical protein I8H84_01885 [Candidatus Saccharibacteria bacterium]|nr:hypothetical protein [Candidatus Saccharibacteria bacterium]MBH1972695.1 hypothetical protein [Candidatus Saccharibacteria bacterium]MBH1990897.1 hypothetical protein [Candidatus Saccharibacteria bacterium]